MHKSCPKCGLGPVAKDGFMRGKQRFRCDDSYNNLMSCLAIYPNAYLTLTIN